MNKASQPLTADGVPIRTGMSLWLGVPGPGMYGMCVVAMRVQGGKVYSDFGACWCGRLPELDLSLWFSTPEAAKAAASRGPAGVPA